MPHISDALDDARAQLRKSYTAQGRKELTEENIRTLALTTVSHALQLVRTARWTFMQVPPLPKERYDEETRWIVMDKAVANHRAEMIATFTVRGVSTETAEMIVDQITALNMNLTLA